MRGFFALRLEPLLPLILTVDVNGFKFLYELLAVSRGQLALLRGLLKFLLVASLPFLANVGLASAYYSFLARDKFWAQLAGIPVVFVWNHAASRRFISNTPYNFTENRLSNLVFHPAR